MSILMSTMIASRSTISRTEQRRHLEDVAAMLFAEKGYEDTTVDQIVAGAQVSKPALYRHFESKKDLYLTLLRRHREELAAAALAPIGPGVALSAALPSILESWFAHVEQHPYIWRMLFRNTTGDAEIEAQHTELHQLQVAADIALLRLVDPPLPEEQIEPLGEVIRASLRASRCGGSSTPIFPEPYSSTPCFA